MSKNLHLVHVLFSEGATPPPSSFPFTLYSPRQNNSRNHRKTHSKGPNKTLGILLNLFTGSNGRRYEVQRIENNEIFFIRLEAKSEEERSMNLREVYRAYTELEDFATVNFKPYVNRRHSPARGLLLHLDLIQ